jgi:hypothetical protein
MAPRFQRSAPNRRTVDGITFDSLKEARRYAELKLLERGGKIHNLQLQPSYPVAIGGLPYCTYTADFSYFCDQRRHLVVEDVKSTGTAKDAAYRLRKKAAQLFHKITVYEVVQ